MKAHLNTLSMRDRIIAAVVAIGLVGLLTVAATLVVRGTEAGLIHWN